MKLTKGLTGSLFTIFLHFSLGMLELVIPGGVGGRRVGRIFLNLNFVLNTRNPSFGETAIKRKMAERRQRYCG